MVTVVSEKVRHLPPYLFAKFQQKKKEKQKQGIDVIDLGIGAPDLPTPDFIIEKFIEEVRKPENHRYSPYSGCTEFREAVALFYEKKYGVKLDPEKEVLALIGSKEGIANLIQALINPGESVLIPNPGYPVYRTAVHLAEGKIVGLPLDENNGYVPNFSQLSETTKQQAKLMLLNYPSNPTSATVDLSTYLKTVSFAKENDILVANDMAYDLITFGNYQSPSILQTPDAKEFAVEFGSLSKSFNMTGWRIGYVVGNEEIIHALSSLKSNIDSSQFLATQKAAAYALSSDLKEVQNHCKIFEARMEKLYDALTGMGFHVEKPRGTIFLWVKVPQGFTSTSFSEKLLEKIGIIVTPGIAFGSLGEGYIRISLSVSTTRLDEVISRLKSIDRKGEDPI